MTRDQIINLVLSRLGKREGSSYLIAQAKLELGLIQKTKLERGKHKPWFLLSTETPIVIAANTRLAGDLPTDFLQEWDEWPLQLYDATNTEDAYTELRKDDFDILDSQYGSNAPGTPEAYSLVGSKVAVFSLSDVEREARMIYFKREAALTDDVQENAWTEYADDLLIGALGEVMSKYGRSDLLQEFKNERATAEDRLYVETLSRLNAAREAYRGDKES